MGAPTRARYLRRKDRGQFILILVVLAIVVSAIAGLVLGEWLRTGEWASPAAVMIALVKGTASWTPLYLIGMGTAAVVVGLLVLAGMLGWRKLGGRVCLG